MGQIERKAGLFCPPEAGVFNFTEELARRKRLTENLFEDQERGSWAYEVLVW